jgi:uncharacterized membrane protein YhaH (DUF805 family)
MMENNELFKLLTRRWVALPLVGAAIVAALFMVVYGAISEQIELATMGGAALFVELGTITGFYFAKKLSEE